MKPQIILACLLLLPTIIDSYKILMLAPFPTPSHWLWLEHFVRELLDRGHEVTAITNYRMKDKHPNYREVIIDPIYDMPGNYPIHDIFDMKYQNDLNNLFLFWNVGLSTTKHALESKNVRNFIDRKDLEFDLIFSEQFFQESFLAFAHKYKAPIVTISTLGYFDFMDRNMGMLTPWAFVPHPILLYTDEMSFLQRCHNVAISLVDVVFRNLFYLPMQNRFAWKYFAELDSKDPIPSVDELEQSISVILVNTHRSISPGRPKMPGLVDIGGAHIKPPKPLPADIQEFLDEAEEGVIYFSLGSYVKSTDMPKDKMQAILDGFSNLNQRVLWKYEDDSLILPDNVKIGKWFPQSDILAHPNVILFITHGGVFGTQEGLYRGVPMLFIPLYGDQHRNAQKMETTGSSLTLKYSDLNDFTFRAKIHELITNEKYLKNAKKISALFRDNPIHPMDEAMYWIEHTIRNKNNSLSKSASISLPWYKYLLLDVVGAVFVTLILLAVITYKILDYIFGPKSKVTTETTGKATGKEKRKKTKTN